jgi:hypothetical protein
MDAAEVIAHIGWTQSNHVTTADVVALIRSPLRRPHCSLLEPRSFLQRNAHGTYLSCSSRSAPVKRRAGNDDVVAAASKCE